jgi:hypothetical protein
MIIDGREIHSRRVYSEALGSQNGSRFGSSRANADILVLHADLFDSSISHVVLQEL